MINLSPIFTSPPLDINSIRTQNWPQKSFKVTAPDFISETMEIPYEDVQDLAEKPEPRKWKRQLPRKLVLEELIKLLGLTEEEVIKIKANLTKVPRNKKREEVDSFRWSDIIKHFTSNKKFRAALEVKGKNLLGSADLMLGDLDFEDCESNFIDELAATGDTSGLKKGNAEKHGCKVHPLTLSLNFIHIFSLHFSITTSLLIIYYSQLLTFNFLLSFYYLSSSLNIYMPIKVLLSVRKIFMMIIISWNY